VPVGDVLVRDLGRDVEHDDAALALRARDGRGQRASERRGEETGARGAHLDVVAVAETAELLLAGRVPHVEADGAKVGVEREGVDLDTESGCASGRRRGQRAAQDEWRWAGKQRRTDVLLLELALLHEVGGPSAPHGRNRAKDSVLDGVINSRSSAAGRGREGGSAGGTSTAMRSEEDAHA